MNIQNIRAHYISLFIGTIWCDNRAKIGELIEFIIWQSRIDGSRLLASLHIAIVAIRLMIHFDSVCVCGYCDCERRELNETKSIINFMQMMICDCRYFVFIGIYGRRNWWMTLGVSLVGDIAEFLNVKYYLLSWLRCPLIESKSELMPVHEKSILSTLKRFSRHIICGKYR